MLFCSFTPKICDLAPNPPTPKAVLSAMAQVLREERTARRKSDDQLRATIATLQERIEQLERRQPASRPRAVGE